MLFDSSKPFDVNKARVYFEKLISQKARFEIKKPREKRTIDQNSFYHVCVGYFAQYTGFTLAESKREIADLLPDLMYYEKNGKMYQRSSSELDTKEMGVLIDFIRDFCKDQLGIYIVSPEEYLIDQFNIKKELEHVR